MSVTEGSTSGEEPPHGLVDTEHRHGAPGGNETILLVDDTRSVRTAVRRALERHGYHVIDASDGETALTLARLQGTIHLLLSDLVMPSMSGSQLANRLQKLHPGLKVLFMSGYTEEAALRYGLATAETPYLMKPFSLETLVSTVRQVLDG